MNLNADFGARASIHAAQLDWTPSPIPGVDRRMLDRVGEEIARATSIVRYAPGSSFSPHTHGGGEEFLVLQGVFQDEHGDCPEGTYVRNPPGTRHTPGSAAGCIIFVKLWQFGPQDSMPVRLDTNAGRYRPGPPGTAVQDLHASTHEHVMLERWVPGATVMLDAPGGIELMVLDGKFVVSGEAFTFQSWLRLPPGTPLHGEAGPSGCRVWIKTGHLTPPPA